MKRDAVENFTSTLAKVVARREARDLVVKHLPYDPPPAWVAAAIVSALRAGNSWSGRTCVLGEMSRSPTRDR